MRDIYQRRHDRKDAKSAILQREGPRQSVGQRWSALNDCFFFLLLPLYVYKDYHKPKYRVEKKIYIKVIRGN